MAELTVQDVPVTGVAPTYVAAAAGGDTFKPRGGKAVFIHAKNGSAGALTVTVDDPRSAQPLGATSFNPDVGVSVPAGGEQMILLSPIERFVDASDNVNLAYSGVTTLTIGVFRVP